MGEAAWRGASDADRIMLVIDSKRGIDTDTQRIMNGLINTKRRAFLILNKIDRIKKRELLSLSEQINRLGTFEETFMISALKGDGLKYVANRISALLPSGPWMFPKDQISDMPQRLMAAEVTREYLLLNTHQEVPYVAAVETDSWEEFRDGSIKINQSIYVQRESQKAIVLGKRGQKIKEIGQRSRAELTAILERKVHLFIHLKVRERWMDDRKHYSTWGLDFDV